MNTIAKDINSLLDLFQKDKSEIEEILAANPASCLARILQLRYEPGNSNAIAEKIRTAALYSGNTRWFEFLVRQMSTNFSGEEMTDHFAVTVPASESYSQPVNLADTVTGDSYLSGEEKDIFHSDDSQPGMVQASKEPPAMQDVFEKQEIEIPEEANRVNKNPESEVESSSTQLEEQVIEKTEVPVDETLNEDGNEVLPESAVAEEAISTPPPRIQESQLTFEPLHTIDYFASQGIRLSEADLTNDRLGQQVKSFTGWLKSMKKLHPGKLPEQDEVIQQIIQSAAEVSNVESDVLTEAMAEVLVKQNKKEKAIEMYEKLSLMNPSKSAYFAAKIESLKTS